MQQWFQNTLLFHESKTNGEQRKRKTRTTSTMNPYLASKNIETHSMLDFTSFLYEAYRQLIFIFISTHLKKDFFVCLCVQHHFCNHFVYRSAASLKLFIRSFFWNQFFFLFCSTVHFLFFLNFNLILVIAEKIGSINNWWEKAKS